MRNYVLESYQSIIAINDSLINDLVETDYHMRLNVIGFVESNLNFLGWQM